LLHPKDATASKNPYFPPSIKQFFDVQDVRSPIEASIEDSTLLDRYFFGAKRILDGRRWQFHNDQSAVFHGHSL
jgi:hypothetical protein